MKRRMDRGKEGRREGGLWRKVLGTTCQSHKPVEMFIKSQRRCRLGQAKLNYEITN